MRYVKLQFGCLLVILYIVITYMRAIKRGKIKTNRQYNLLIGYDKTAKWKKVLLNLPGMLSVLLTTAGIGELYYIKGATTWYSMGFSVYICYGMIVIAVFYAIYFAKMMSQKRHGIQTHQIGRVKEKSVHKVEVLMSIATLAAPVIQIMSMIFGWNHMPANARFTGFCIGMLGDLIFLTSVLCMKDSWRAGIPDKDRTKLVTEGIYRYSRNPAFLGFDFMYIELLLMYFNLSMLAVSAFAIIMLHLQILQEERYLTENYGESYREYRKHVFRYLGRR